MPLTTLDTSAALIVIDLQEDLVGVPVVHPIAGIIAARRTSIGSFLGVPETSGH